MAFLRRNWFPIALVLSFIAGYLFRGLGVALNPASVGTYAVVIVIFLITGYTMPTEALLRGVTDLKLHLYMELFIFVVFPLYVVASVLLIGDLFRPEVVAGLFALAVLQSTGRALPVDQLTGIFIRLAWGGARLAAE